MKILLKTAIPFAAAFIFSACGNSGSSEPKNETSAANEHEEVTQTPVATSGKPVLKNDKLNAVYQHYIHLTTALTNDDAAEAKVAASAIEAGAREVDGASGIAAAAAKVTTAPDIEAQRVAYSGLSRDIAALIKKDGMSGGELYVVFCPMAFNNKGATWISGSQEIRNPYFGEKMIRCGEVQDTIK